MPQAWVSAFSAPAPMWEPDVRAHICDSGIETGLSQGLLSQTV